MPSSAMPSDGSFTIVPLQSPADLEAARQLFLAYATSLGFSLCFQNFDQELASLPGKYAPPKGTLLLARDAGGQAIGCVALRPLNEQYCEMKRLYVAPEARGLGLGKALVDAIIAAAARIGYREMRLDTLPSMEQAIRLYRQMGFVPIPAYNDSPLSETLYLARTLHT